MQYGVVLGHDIRRANCILYKYAFTLKKTLPDIKMTHVLMTNESLVFIMKSQCQASGFQFQAVFIIRHYEQSFDPHPLNNFYVQDVLQNLKDASVPDIWI